MDTSTFFAKKRQEQQKLHPSPPHQSNLPWWQDPEYTKSNRDRPTEPLETVEDHVKHDYSRADHLKSGTGNCPNCGSVSYMKPSASASARCFDCGYIQGREVNDLDTLNIMANDAQTIKVRQTADGGASKYRARISRDANQIRQANAELEQSYTGRAHVDS